MTWCTSKLKGKSWFSFLPHPTKKNEYLQMYRHDLYTFTKCNINVSNNVINYVITISLHQVRIQVQHVSSMNNIE